jgi:hypothetical protein
MGELKCQAAVIPQLLNDGIKNPLWGSVSRERAQDFVNYGAIYNILEL